MNDDVDPEQLLQSALAGNRQAIGRLLDHFRMQMRESLHGDLQGHLQQRIDESDVIQQTCVQAVQRFEQFRGSSLEEFWGWLRQIEQNVLIDLVRHHGAQKRSLEQEARSAEIQQLPAHATTPSQNAMRGERRQQLEQAILQLPDGQREAIRLRYLEGLAVSEISQQMERSEDAVAGLLKRGVSQLKEILSGFSM